MNIRKATDYSELFRNLDQILAGNHSQMEIAVLIGQAVCNRPEKGAAVAAAEYIQENYPDKSGFSPRNLRRMRTFYRLYCNDREMMDTAMQLGWTQNVAIMEAELGMADRLWYLKAALQNGWTKSVLIQKIKVNAHLEENCLDINDMPCYNGDSDNEVSDFNDANTLCLSRQHLQKLDGRVHYEGPGRESRTFQPVRNKLCCYQHRGDWESSLSIGPTEAGRAWNRLHWKNSPTAAEQRLREIRPPDRHGSGQPAEYVSHLRRGFPRQDSPADGVHRPPRRGGRSLVYQGLRYGLV